ncbi:MAG: DUF6600 domain-containing protein [Acidobacteriota bacterium]
MKKYAAMAALLVVSFCFSPALRGEDQPKYTNESFARLSFITGSVYIQKGQEAGYEDAVVNMPIEEGDRLGTTDGRAEVYLGKKNYVRLDNNTKLDIVSLPKKGSDLIRLRVLNGHVYLSVNKLDEEKTVEIHTPDASFYVLAEGLYRIDVSENKKTDIFVFSGVMEAAGKEGSQLLTSEQSLGIEDGLFSSRPVRFLAVAEDNFDRWSESRESSLRVEIATRHLPEGLEDFEGELAEYGRWNWVNPYGWVWVPGGIADDWRPYYNGSWVWLTLGGWTWLPYEPWGWAPFHYGRWGWYRGLGWYWIPGSIWGPAWVSWWWGLDYYAWAPLGWWGGMPIVIIDNWYYPNWHGPFYPYNSRALTVVHKDQLKAKSISSVALRGESLKGLDKITMTTQTPQLKPVSTKISPDAIQATKATPRKAAGDSAPAGGSGVKSPGLREPERVYPPTVRAADRSKQTTGASESRRIRGNDTPQAQSSGKQGDRGAGTFRKNALGYPPSPDITLGKSSAGRRTSGSNSIRNQFYKYLRGDKSSARTSSSSRGSVGKSSGSSGSKARASSGSRSSSSGSRSSGSRSSGSVRKKG